MIFEVKIISPFQGFMWSVYFLYSNVIPSGLVLLTKKITDTKMMYSAIYLLFNSLILAGLDILSRIGVIADITPSGFYVVQLFLG